MGLYGGNAPAPDPRIGDAAIRSAELGEEYLAFMRDQSDISNKWAEEDRTRYKSVYEPLQDQFIEEAQNYDTPEKRQERARQAVADVSQQAALTDDARKRDMMRMGVDPRSGRYAAGNRSADIQVGLAKAGAANTSRRQVEDQGRALRASAVNMGSGFAVNPATSLGLANNAAGSGFQGAMRGQGQMGNLLNTQYQQQMQQWNANQSATSGLMSGLGNLAGIALMSSKDFKTDKKPARGVLDALKEMPVEEWTYKEGMGDGGRHVGPYAEDFQKATGKGDGQTIPVVDAIGMTIGAVQELSEKVDDLAGGKKSATKKKPKKTGRGVLEAVA